MSDPVEAYYWLHNLIRNYLPLKLWVLSFDGKRVVRWHDIFESGPRLPLIDFESQFKHEGQRMAYYEESCKKAVKAREVVEGNYRGVHDLFVPVDRQDGLDRVLMAGLYQRQLPQRKELEERFAALSGRQASACPAQFQKWLDLLLPLPLLEAPVLSAQKELLRLYAALLSGSAEPQALLGRLDFLRRRVFVKHLRHPHWAKDALSGRRGSQELQPWEAMECGLGAYPSGILLLRLKGEGLDAVELKLKRRLLEAKALGLSQLIEPALPELLEGGDLAFLCDLRERRSHELRRLELREKGVKLLREAEKISQAKGACSGAILSGPEDSLPACLARAASSLGRLEHGVRIAQDGEAPAQARQGRSAQALERLEQALCADEAEWGEAREAFMEGLSQEMEAEPSQWRSAARAHLASLFLRAKTAAGLSHAEVSEALALLKRRLQEAMGLASIFEELRAGLDLARAFTLKPRKAGKEARLSEVEAWIRENFRKALSLKEAASLAGLSVPSFCAAFKSRHGEPMGDMLKRLRIEEAKRLLLSGPLPVSRVAAYCGFGTARHFSRTFQQSVGNAPAQWRSLQLK